VKLLGAGEGCPRLPRVASYLDEIVAYHRRRAASGGPGHDARALAAAVASAPAVRPFGAALVRDRAGGVAGGVRRGASGVLPASAPVGAPGSASGGAPGGAPGRVSVIAEVKRRSPSKGDLAPDLDVSSLACSYQAGGAACLSVLTDEPYFGGSVSDLVEAREATELPVLRKDFTVCSSDVMEARGMGADAVLLIVAALSPEELARFTSLATSLGMTSLVEVHDEAELSVAVEVALPAAGQVEGGSAVIGVNQRDLRTFRVDPDRAMALGALVPAGVVKVAESGIRDRADALRLAEAGFDAVLVGETLVRSADPAAMVASLRGGPVAEEVASCS
jgi:indole-3-glycerol phosphate synthase